MGNQYKEYYLILPSENDERAAAYCYPKKLLIQQHLPQCYLDRIRHKNQCWKIL